MFTSQAVSDACCQNEKHPEFGNIHACMFSPPDPSTPPMASGEPAAPCCRCSPSAASSPSHLLLLAQVLKLDTALVALKAAGQELLLELEKNQ